MMKKFKMSFGGILGTFYAFLFFFSERDFGKMRKHCLYFICNSKQFQVTPSIACSTLVTVALFVDDPCGSVVHTSLAKSRKLVNRA